MIGFFITFIVGYLASRLLKALNLTGTNELHSDDRKNEANFDLFFPPIAKRLRKQQGKRDSLLSNANNFLNVSFCKNRFQTRFKSEVVSNF